MKLHSLTRLIATYSAAGAGLLAQKPAAGSDPEETVQMDRYVVAAPIAGRYATGSGPKVVLSSIEILLVPGSAADINRALQTLPGVQAADEGNALFVRGGDSGETGTWINGLRFPTNAQVNTPLGSVAGTVSPWQARAVDFAAGGFGADTGNVLSGAVKIETYGAPDSDSYWVNLGIGNQAASVAQRWGKNAGATFTVDHQDLRPFLGLYDFKRSFAEAPTGDTYSFNGSWDGGPAGEVRWFAYGNTSRLGLRLHDERGAGVYRSASETGFQAVSWRGRVGAWKHELNAGAGRMNNDEDFAGQAWQTRTRSRQVSTRSQYDAGKFLFRGGVDGTSEDTRFTRGGRRVGADERLAAGWGEMDTTVGRDVRMIGGLRGWDSRRAGGRGVDPRLAFTWQPRRAWTYSVAGGRYHQVAPGSFYANGLPKWPAMAADQGIVSLEWKGGGRLLRVETYAKNYRDVVALDRERTRPYGGGTGAARGLDLMFKTPLPADAKARLTWSMVDADRTDPTIGRLAPAPWAVRHSAALILDRPFGDWSVSVAGRWATGRAFTPVLGAGEPGATGRPTPLYGDPNSERLPDFRRVDFTLVRTWEVNPRLTAVFYFAGFNLFGWANVSSFDYADDFTTRRPVPGVFQRSVYFGVNLFYR